MYTPGTSHIVHTACWKLSWLKPVACCTSVGVAALVAKCDRDGSYSFPYFNEMETSVAVHVVQAQMSGWQVLSSPTITLVCLSSPQIKAPILVLLGADDLRVPPSQGKYLYHTLRAMGKKTK